jgi:hypothetical protein
VVTSLAPSIANAITTTANEAPGNSTTMPLIEKKAARTGQENRSYVRGHLDAGFRRTVRYHDDVAAGDEARLLPGFQAPAGALSLPSPPAAEFGRRQAGAPAWLTAQPFKRGHIIEGPDGFDIRHCLLTALHHLIV